jgi:TRAP-type uncharacterized transport system substrate-binding protein
MRPNHKLLAAFVVAGATCFAFGPALAQKSARATTPPSHENMKEAVNAGIVGLAAGQLEGAPIRLATEMARVVDDGNTLHVLPFVTRGPAENIDALLYLRGVDLAIVNTDVLEQFAARAPWSRNRIAYILNLFPSEVHVLVRPGIESLEDLKGLKVNFNTKGTAAAYSGPLIFDKLGIQVDKTFIPHQSAIEQMQSGDIAAVFFITSKPVDVFLKRRFADGFKFLPVPYDERVSDYYLPASLTHDDYPPLIHEGEEIQTISVPTALVAFNWAPNTDRYRRVTRLVDALFANIARLQAPGFDPKWQSVNLAAEVPSLPRFRAAQEWLDRTARAEATASREAQPAPTPDPDAARRIIARETQAAPAEQEHLVKEFLEWARNRR